MHEHQSASVLAFPAPVDEMAAATEEARATLQLFIDAFHAPKPNQSGFHLRVRFEVDGMSETVWLTGLSDLTDSRRRPNGVLANEGRLAGFNFGKRVGFSLNQVTDWTYMEDGQMVGGYTTKALLKMRARTSTVGSLHSFLRPRRIDEARRFS